MQHHVYASHMYTYIRYRYRFFLWTLSFLKIWIHFLMPDVHLCNTSYYVGFLKVASLLVPITLENRNRSWSQTQKEVIDTTHGCFGGNGMSQPVPYPQSRNQYIFSDALSCSTTPDMMSKKLKKMLKCGIAKS